MMAVIQVLIAFLVTFVTKSSSASCPMIKYMGNFDTTNHVKDHALVGSSYINMTTKTVLECFSLCIQDCRCVSYQLIGNRCELVDDNRNTVPAARFQRLSGYLYFELKQEMTVKDPRCSKGCNNGCCRWSPCRNGGTCIELCDNVTRKFECKCRPWFIGRVCEYPIDCKAYSFLKKSGKYPIMTPHHGIKTVYCDLTSEPGMVWTVIESFALQNNKNYKSKPLSEDYPNNVNDFNWLDYRLPLTTMKRIKSHATHWRVTCRYEREGLVKTDYMQGRLSSFDILKNYPSGCYNVEYINVRGITCKMCTTHIGQYHNIHVTVDSELGLYYKCNINFIQGAFKIIRPCRYDNRKLCYDYCENFGFYNLINSLHRCSSSPSSTTQWWIGSNSD